MKRKYKKGGSQADDMSYYNDLQMYRRHTEQIGDENPTEEKFLKFMEDCYKKVIPWPQTYITINKKSK
jgi:hypothetical protein